MMIRLEPMDAHWVRINDPSAVAKDIGEWWENNKVGAQPSATIDIKIPEVIGVGGKAKIRWYSNDWHGIGLYKSKDGVTFTPIWTRSAHYRFDHTIEIELDPAYEFYRIYFSDGRGSGEKTRVHKNVEVILAEVEAHDTALTIAITDKAGNPISKGDVGETVYITGQLRDIVDDVALQGAFIKWYLGAAWVTGMSGRTNASGIYSIPYTLRKEFAGRTLRIRTYFAGT